MEYIVIGYDHNEAPSFYKASESATSIETAEFMAVAEGFKRPFVTFSEDEVNVFSLASFLTEGSPIITVIGKTAKGVPTLYRTDPSRIDKSDKRNKYDIAEADALEIGLVGPFVSFDNEQITALKDLENNESFKEDSKEFKLPNSYVSGVVDGSGTVQTLLVLNNNAVFFDEDSDEIVSNIVGTVSTELLIPGGLPMISELNYASSVDVPHGYGHYSLIETLKRNEVMLKHGDEGFELHKDLFVNTLRLNAGIDLIDADTIISPSGQVIAIDSDGVHVYPNLFEATGSGENAVFSSFASLGIDVGPDDQFFVSASYNADKSSLIEVKGINNQELAIDALGNIECQPFSGPRQ